jgi:hypothetical protein
MKTNGTKRLEANEQTMKYVGQLLKINGKRLK